MAFIAAEMLAQIGAFALPALLPDYIARWDLSKTEAGWLVGIVSPSDINRLLQRSMSGRSQMPASRA